MTATYQTPAPLSAYLRRATFGLPPQRREEVWNELEEHVLCRAEQLEFQGLSQGEALATALRELGPPLRVSAAMNGVHNMPKLIAFVTLGTLAVSAGLYALAQQTPAPLQIPVQTTAPGQKCLKATDPQPNLPVQFSANGWTCYQDDSVNRKGIFIDFKSVKTAFDTMGFPANISSNGQILEIRPKPWSIVPMRLNASFRRDGASYLSLDTLLGLAMNPGSPVLLRGYDRPSFVFGNHVLEMQQSSPDSAQEFYRQTTITAVVNLYRKFMPSALSLNASTASAEPREIQTDLPAGEVVASIVWTEANGKPGQVVGTPQQSFEISVGVVDAQGRVKLRIPEGATFTTTPHSAPSADILLLRLTNTPLGNLKSGIFQPKE